MGRAHYNQFIYKYIMSLLMIIVHCSDELLQLVSQLSYNTAVSLSPLLTIMSYHFPIHRSDAVHNIRR